MDELDDLIGRLPPATVSTHHGELATHAHDRSALSLLRELRGDRVPPPAAVVFPSSTDEVATVLAWAGESGTAIVPRGAGSGVAGGAEAVKRSVVVDLSRMNHVLSVDEVSQTAHVEAGVRGGELEEALAPRGLTGGLDLESLHVSTVGGWIASAAAGVSSAGYGVVEDLVAGLTAVLAGGEIVRIDASPRSGFGPDLRRLFVGSEGTFGIVTEATLVVSRAPTQYLWDSLRPNSFESGSALVREVVQRGYRPLVLRLLDADEAGRVFGKLGHRGAALLVAFDADAPAAGAQWFNLRELGKEFGARSLGPDLAEHWWDRRHEPLEAYDAAMGPDRAEGRGAMIDGVDVSCVWRRLPRVYEDVRSALLENVERVGCVLAHPYPSGASLRFSFLVRAGTDYAVEDAYVQAWRAAVEASLAAGGTLAHHQGVGVLRLPFVTGGAGQGVVETLRRLKAGLDPGFLLNPGKLIPPEER